MAYSPVAFVAPNYRDYDTWWLKAYEAGKTTPKKMALDGNGDTLVAKLQVNQDGFLVSAGGALVIPYLDSAYDLWLFPAEEEADNNDTSEAIRVAGNINPLIGSSGGSSVGLWDAKGNLPDITGELPAENEYWIVTSAGDTGVGGISSWGIYDWAVYDTIKGWIKIDYTSKIDEQSAALIASHNRSQESHEELFDAVNGNINAVAEGIETAIEAHNHNISAHPELSEFITSEADRAENAADAAAINSDIYPGVAAGIAGTSSGEYFSIVSTVSTDYLDLYRNAEGIGQYQKSYPSSVLVRTLERYSNQVSGESGMSLDSNGGPATIELDSNEEKPLVLGTFDHEYLSIDAKNKSVSIAKVKPDVTIIGEISVSDKEHFQELTLSESALEIGTNNGSLKFDTVNNKLTSSLEVIDNSQNPELPADWDDSDVPVIFNGVPPEYDISNRLYQGTPSITKVGDRFWLTWRADVNYAGEAPGNFFVVGYSDDECVTVTESHIITYDNLDHQIVDPMLWTNPENNEVWIFWGAFGKGLAQDGVCGCWYSVLENPNASFFSWSTPTKYRNIGDPRRPVRISGEWYQCVDMWRSDADYPPLFPSTAGCEFITLNPSTKTIKNIGHNTPNNGVSFSGFFETELVQLSSGRLMSTTRGAGSSGLTRSFSDDHGKAWSAQEDYTVLGDISASRIWLGRTPSGRIIIAYNNDLSRRTLTLKLSEDDGETFPYSVILEGAMTPETVSYPILSFDGDKIYTCYDYGRETSAEIRVTTVFESEILTNTAVPVINIVSGPIN